MNVENAIQEVQSIYRSITGHDIRPMNAELPPEVDPQTHVDRRYRELRTMLEPRAAMPRPAWSPPADVHELPNELRVEMDLTGVPRDRVSVAVVASLLVVRGERPENDDSPHTARVLERPRGPFAKVVALPATAASERIEATMREGLLVITVPVESRNGEIAERRIEVRPG